MARKGAFALYFIYLGLAVVGKRPQFSFMVQNAFLAYIPVGDLSPAARLAVVETAEHLRSATSDCHCLIDSVFLG